jgi:predicted NACHT family NTPase
VHRIIISCRTAAYRYEFKQFFEIEIANFDDEQIQQFIQNWFSSDVDIRGKTAERCWQLLQENQGIKELAHSPLLLTFICLVSRWS